MTPRIIIAKYVPDLGRMEPRNIGVFLWATGELQARFLEAEQAAFVNEPETFRRWKTYWTSLISSDFIKPVRGRSVAKKDASCMDALLTTQDGNYLLVDAGEMIESVGKREISKATDFLFHELVVPQNVSARDSGDTLKNLCQSLFVQSKLAERKDYRVKFPVVCGLFGPDRPLHFSYGFGEESPLALFQRVNLSQEVSVNNAALTLHEVVDNAVVNRENCAALIQGSAITSKAAQNCRQWLEKVCCVIDVESGRASEELEGMVPRGHHRSAV